MFRAPFAVQRALTARCGRTSGGAIRRFCLGLGDLDEDPGKNIEISTDTPDLVFVEDLEEETSSALGSTMGLKPKLVH